MTNKELIEILKTFPEDSEVFYAATGRHYNYNHPNGLETKELYDFIPTFYKELNSCRSSLPSSSYVVNDVILLEYD